MPSDTMKLRVTGAEIDVEKLMLDLDNPRLFHQKLTGSAPTTQEDLEKSISGDTDFKKLLKSIKKSGVLDPIWVLPQTDGTYLVIEGNRRTTCLRVLIESGAEKSGVDYTRVRANVIDPDTDPREIKLQKARLQTGKRAWGVFNVSALIHEFHHVDLMAIEDIATEMQETMAYIRKLLKSYEMFVEYSTSTGDTNQNRFAYYNEAPKKVIEWVEDSPANKSDYHKWINPTTGRAKIRSAATKGGLRDFAKVIEDPEAVSVMRDISNADVNDAMVIVEQNNISKAMPWLSKILTLQANITGITDEERCRLAGEPKTKIHLKSLRAACDKLLADLEALDIEWPTGWTNGPPWSSAERTGRIDWTPPVARIE